MKGTEEVLSFFYHSRKEKLAALADCFGFRIEEQGRLSRIYVTEKIAPVSLTTSPIAEVIEKNELKDFPPYFEINLLNRDNSKLREYHEKFIKACEI